MKKKKIRRPVPLENGSGRKRFLCWEMVLIDQGPLRRKAASDCSREMARLERARAEWRRYEVEDKAAFARWEAVTFGPLLSRLREIESALREKEALMMEVDLEMLFGGAGTPRAAYARVKQRRNSPPPPPPAGARPGDEARGSGYDSAKPPEGDDGDSFGDDFISDEDMEEIFLFEDYLFYELGLDPDRMSDTKYDRLFEEFRAKRRGRSRAQSRSSGPEPDAGRWAPPAPPKPAQERVKELYRVLVRRLHPDMRADSNAEVSALWHEVQEAYSHGNVERLEMLLAFTDIQSNAAGEQTSLFQMRAVLAELRSSYNALQKNLRAAKKEQAWNFNRRTDRKMLEQRMRWELEGAIAMQAGELRRLEELIASWDAPRKGAKKKGAKQGRGGAGFAARNQAQFPF